MKFITLAVLGAVPALAAVASVDTRNTEGLPFPLVPLTWIGVVEEGGPEVKVTGSDIKNIVSKIDADYPGFAAKVEATVANITLEETGLDKRQWPDPGVVQTIFCDDAIGSAKVWAIAEGLNYLRGLGGKWYQPPNSCSRISCSWSSAITVCNENAGHTHEDHWSIVADRASYLASKCMVVYNLHPLPGKNPGQITEFYTKGKTYMAGRWNLRIDGEFC